MDALITFHGRFSHVLYKDIKTGQAMFIVETEDPHIPRKGGHSGVRCFGYIAHFPKGVPLRITGSMQGSKAPFIQAHTVSVMTENETATRAFLESRTFHGIGPKTAAAIVEEIGHDLFSFCEREDAVDRLENIPQVTRAIAGSLVARVRDYKHLQELVMYLTSYGATYESAKKIYARYGSRAIQVMEENPYILYFAGVAYENREAMAKKSGMRALDERRVSAIIHEAMDRIEASGDTCATLRALLAQIARIEKAANMGYRTSVLVVLANLLTKPGTFVIETFEGIPYIYRKPMATLEEKAARHVVRLTQESEKKKEIPPVALEGIAFDADQKEAFRLLEKPGIAILTGGPGTGKSTLIKGLLQAYKKAYSKETFALCAPTGAAAKRLKEVTGENATTIHRLLDVRPYGKGEIRYKDEYNPLPHTFIVVDEFSMVDTELFTMLCAAIKTGSLLLLVGDENQLPSVGAGNVLKELLQNDRVRVKRLTNIHRQQSGSTIIENAQKIKKGQVDLEINRAFQIYRATSDEEMERMALAMAQKALAKKEEYQIKLYSPLKKRAYRISTYSLNRQIHAMAKGAHTQTLLYNGITFAEGDPVVMLRNNYKKGYMNGDEAKILGLYTRDTGVSVKLQMLDGAIVLLGEDELADMDLGYCITIHKSQGNESDAGIILVPESRGCWTKFDLCRRPRAKKQNIIISENGALERAIRTDYAVQRKTNLNHRIQRLLRQSG